MNFWDRIPENQKKQVFNYVESQINKSVEKIKREHQNRNIITPKLFAVSSLTKENFQELEDEIKTYLTNIFNIFNKYLI